MAVSLTEMKIMFIALHSLYTVDESSVLEVHILYVSMYQNATPPASSILITQLLNKQPGGGGFHRGPLDEIVSTRSTNHSLHISADVLPRQLDLVNWTSLKSFAVPVPDEPSAKGLMPSLTAG